MKREWSDYAPHLVRVRASESSFGMGFRVGDAILTAAHCMPMMEEGEEWCDFGRVGSGRHVLVESWDGTQRATLRIDYFSPCHDIAVLGFVDDEEPVDLAQPVEVDLELREQSREDLEQRRPCLKDVDVAIPTHLETVIRGTISVGFWWQFACTVPGTVEGGNSGAPVFDERRQRVIGVLASSGGGVGFVRLAPVVPPVVRRLLA